MGTEYLGYLMHHKLDGEFSCFNSVVTWFKSASLPGFL